MFQIDTSKLDTLDLKPIPATAQVSEVIEIFNFNIEQIKLKGGGDKGVKGDSIVGPPGRSIVGGRGLKGDRGSIYFFTNQTLVNSQTINNDDTNIFRDKVPIENDLIIDAQARIYRLDQGVDGNFIATFTLDLQDASAPATNRLVTTEFDFQDGAINPVTTYSFGSSINDTNSNFILASRIQGETADAADLARLIIGDDGNPELNNSSLVVANMLSDLESDSLNSFFSQISLKFRRNKTSQVDPRSAYIGYRIEPKSSGALASPAFFIENLGTGLRMVNDGDDTTNNVVALRGSNVRMIGSAPFSSLFQTNGNFNNNIDYLNFTIDGGQSTMEAGVPLVISSPSLELSSSNAMSFAAQGITINSTGDVNITDSLNSLNMLGSSGIEVISANDMSVDVAGSASVSASTQLEISTPIIGIGSSIISMGIGAAVYELGAFSNEFKGVAGSQDFIKSDMNAVTLIGRNKAGVGTNINYADLDKTFTILDPEFGLDVDDANGEFILCNTDANKDLKIESAGDLIVDTLKDLIIKAPEEMVFDTTNGVEVNTAGSETPVRLSRGTKLVFSRRGIDNSNSPFTPNSSSPLVDLICIGLDNQFNFAINDCDGQTLLSMDRISGDVNVRSGGLIVGGVEIADSNGNYNSQRISNIFLDLASLSLVAAYPDELVDNVLGAFVSQRHVVTIAVNAGSNVGAGMFGYTYSAIITSINALNASTSNRSISVRPISSGLVEVTILYGVNRLAFSTDISVNFEVTANARLGTGQKSVTESFILEASDD